MEKKFILNPGIKIVPNRGRNILYFVDDFFRSPEQVCPLAPSDSIFLLLFDGTRTKEEVLKDFNRVFKDSNGFDVEKNLERLKTQTGISDLLVDSSFLDSNQIERFGNRVDPMTLLIPRDEFDLQNGWLRLDYPLSLNFNVTTSCPFSCEYCYHPLNEITPLISLSRLKEVLLQFKQCGCESVMLTGGDPMLRPDIDDVLEYLHEIDFFYSLSTKSVMSDARIDKLHDRAGLDRIQISLDSSRPEIVEKLVHSRLGYFNACVHQIKHMLSKGIDVRLKSVLTSLNADYIEEYFDFAAELGIKHVQVVGYGRSGSRHKDYLFPTEEQMKHAAESVRNAKKKYPEMVIVGGGYSLQTASPVGECEIFEKRAICNAGRFAVTMLPNGEVTVCEQLPYDKRYIIGDLSKVDLMDWWNGEELKQWLLPPDRSIFAPGVPCASCVDDVYDICHRKFSRCLRYCREYFGSTEMPDVRCPKASFEEFRIG